MAKIIVALFWIGIATSLYLTTVEWIGGIIQRRMAQ
jgi:hypothetical protein